MLSQCEWLAKHYMALLTRLGDPNGSEIQEHGMLFLHGKGKVITGLVEIAAILVPQMLAVSWREVPENEINGFNTID